MEQLGLSLALAGVALGCMSSPPARAAGRPLDTAAIEAATGLKGSFNKAEKVFKNGHPATSQRAARNR